MSDPKVIPGTDAGVEKTSADAAHLDEAHEAQVKRSALVAEIGHVAALGMPNAAELEKRIVRKLDLWMLPQLWILYMFNYLNRTNIAQARLNTFNEDLNLKDGDYQTAVAILTVGYMLAQLPSNMLITFVRPSIYLPVAAFIWSGVSIATVGCTSAGGLWAVQFVLGIVEAPLFPGAVFLMSCWYTRREFALRVALLYSGLVLAQAFSGLIAAGVFAGLDGPGGLAGWQWLFILEGAGSAFFAITAYFILPNYPESKNGGAMWYMTEDMRKVAAARILDDRVEYAEKSTVWVGLKLAVTDIKLYMFLFMNICITSSYGFNNFFPTIVNGLGFGTRVTALLMTAPPYVLGTICTFFVAWDSDRRAERGLHIIIPLSFSVVGFIATVATGNATVRYVMTFLYAAGCFSANTLQYTWAVSTMGQTPEKRAAGGAIVNIFGHLAPSVHPPASSNAATTFHQPWSTDVKPNVSMAPPTEEFTSTVPGKSPKQPKRDVFVCPEVHCGKQFPRSFALRRHMRIHTGTKPYACDYQGCSQRFNTSGNLSRHKRIHSGERPYPCCFETCGKRFNTSTKLKRHMRIHFPDGQNLFRCTEQACSWACDNYKEYVQHQKLHNSVAEGFQTAGDENMNGSNGNAMDQKSPKSLKSTRVMPSPMGGIHPETEPRHVEFPQQMQPAVMNEDFYHQDRSRMYGAPSNLMMMQKEPHQQREENDYRRLSGHVLAERLQPPAPRLPFPTRAFPSETVGMSSGGLLGSSFHPLTHLPTTSSHRYYESPAPASTVEMVTSSSPSYTSVGSYASTQAPYSSYLRNGESNVLVSSYQPTMSTTTFMSSSEQYTQPMRQEDMNRQYESSSPHDVQQSPPHQPQSQPGYGSNPAPAEFTGEELSAVLELMKDS